MLAKIKDKKIYIVIFVVLISSIIIFNKYIFGKGWFVYEHIGSDSLTLYWPDYAYFRNALWNNTLGFWSFQHGVGNSIFAEPTFLFDPFNIILFLFTKETMPYGLILVTIIKIGVITYFAYRLFLILNFTKYVSALCAFIWGLNGYVVLWSVQYHFVTAIVIFTILIYSFELYFQNKKCIPLILSIFILGVFSVYFLYIISIFMSFYCIIRYIGIYKISGIIKYIFNLMGIYLCGVCLGAIVIFPSIYVLLNNPRVNLGTDISTKLASFYDYAIILLRHLSTTSVGIEKSYCIVSPYSGPTLYSSLLVLILLPLFLFNKKMFRQNIGFIIFIIASLVFVNISVPIFNAFSGDSYRWTFVVIMLEIILIAKFVEPIFNKESNLNNLCIINCLIFLFIYIVSLFYVLNKNNANISDIPTINRTYKYIILFFSLYIIFFMLNKYKLFREKYGKVILFALVCIEIISFSNVTVSYERSNLNSDYITSRNGYFDHTLDCVEYLKELDKSSFYRIDKNYQSVFLNDSVMQNYYGIKNFTSNLNPEYRNFSEKMGYPVQYNFITGFDDSSEIRGLLGVKYVLSKEPIADGNYKLLNSIDGIYIYTNLNYMQFGHIYNNYIQQKDFEKLTDIEKKNKILDSVVIKEEIDYKLSDEKEKVIENKVNDFQFGEDNVKGSIETNENGILFLPIPYDKGWKLTIDGRKQELLKVNIGFLGVFIEKGKHNIVLEYEPPFYNIGKIISIISLLILFIIIYIKHKRLNISYINKGVELLNKSVKNYKY